MKKYRIVGLLVIVALMSTLLAGCFAKGENDPWMSFSSRKKRMSNNWNIVKFEGKYLRKLNCGENRKIDLLQSGSSVSETTQYITMCEDTQDSLQAGQDTTIEWKGKLDEAFYNINEDGTFTFVYEYTLSKTHSKYYENGNPDSIHPFFPPYPGKPFTIDSTMKRNYRTEYKGRWNFLNDIDGWEEDERVIFEIESSAFIINYAVTYVCDAEDDDGRWENQDPVDTTFSSQSLESITQKFANAEYNEVWAIDGLNGEAVTMTRPLDHVYTHAETGFDGFKETKSGSELYELEE
jgi:hypothetical protein